MQIIVVINPGSNPWQVVDRTFTNCPSSPVRYNHIDIRQPVRIISTCGQVAIENLATGATGTATAIRIQ